LKTNLINTIPRIFIKVWNLNSEASRAFWRTNLTTKTYHSIDYKIIISSELYQVNVPMHLWPHRRVFIHGKLQASLLQRSLQACWHRLWGQIHSHGRCLQPIKKVNKNNNRIL